MLKVFQTRRNSNYKWTQKFNQIYEKSSSSFFALIQVFKDAFSHLIFKLSKKQSSAQFFALPIVLTLFLTVMLICSNISWLVNITSPYHGKLCKVRMYWNKLLSARWLNIGEFLPNIQHSFLRVSKFHSVSPM